MALDGIGQLEIHCMLSKLDPREAATVACFSKRYRDLASDDLLWSKFCSEELDLSSPEDSDGNPCPDFLYPLLQPGEKEFVYESCAPLPSSGSVEGSFTFVPRSLADSKGEMFEVQVARFPLRLSYYIL